MPTNEINEPGLALTTEEQKKMRHRDPRDRESYQWLRWLAYLMLAAAVFMTLFILCPPMIAGVLPAWVAYVFGTAIFGVALAYVERRVNRSTKDGYWFVLRNTQAKEIVLAVSMALLAAALTSVLFHAGALLAPTLLGAAVYWKALTAASFSAAVLGGALMVKQVMMKSPTTERGHLKRLLSMLLASALIASIFVFAAPALMGALGAAVAASGFAYTSMQLVAMGGGIMAATMLVLGGIMTQVPKPAFTWTKPKHRSLPTGASLIISGDTPSTGQTISTVVHHHSPEPQTRASGGDMMTGLPYSTPGSRDMRLFNPPQSENLDQTAARLGLTTNPFQEQHTSDCPMID